MLKLGVDFIKIDKMFVDAIDTERYSTTIIETLVSLARGMHMEIIAEGVETLEQVQHLRERDPQGAGYVFAPPLPGSSFLKLLAASDAAPQRSERQTGGGRMMPAGLFASDCRDIAITCALLGSPPLGLARAVGSFSSAFGQRTARTRSCVN